MTIITPTGITGITSITSTGNTLQFQTAAGGNIDVSGVNVSSGTNINITGIMTVGAGTTTAPSISPSGDSNTGIFFPSSDTIAFAEGGIEAARFDSNGRLGIGTTNPSTIFHIRQPGDLNGITITHATRIGTWKLEHSGTNSENFVFRQNNGTSDASSLVIGRDVHRWYTGNTEKMALISNGNLGIGTDNPACKLDIRGNTTSNITADVQIARTGTLNTSVGQGAGIQFGNLTSGKYVFIQGADDNFQIFNYNGSSWTERLRLDVSGRITTPYQPAANWSIAVNTSTAVRTLSTKRDANINVSSVAAGNGSSHGSVGRFTAPVAGVYLITIRGTGSATSGSNELLSVYGSWSTIINVLQPTNEVLDLRVTPVINDGVGWSCTLYLSANDYWELDWYRPVATSYLGTTIWDISTVLLG